MAAVIVVLVSITGIFLNHTSEMSLGKQPVRSGWLLSWYGLSIPTLTSYPVGEYWLSGDDNGYVYLADRQIADCRGDFGGAVETERFLVVNCGVELLLISHDGALLERVNEAYGAPAQMSRIGSCGDSICVGTPVGTVSVDLEKLVWQSATATVNWGQPQPLPDLYYQQLLATQMSVTLSWEKVIQDLHSGRILGSFGVWLIDLSALFLLFLSLSGFILWYQRRSH